GSGDEGTAMLEIVHDLAPGAQLYFATAFTSISSFATNIRALRTAGCDIIVDDVFYYVESPIQDGQISAIVSNTNGGIVTQAVNDVTAAGALYFSSAGNEGNLNDGTSGTWEGDFVDGGASAAPLTAGRRHNFGGQPYDVSTAGETHGHSSAAAAFSVAATPAAGPFPNPFTSANVVETFRSNGPRRLFFQPNGTAYTPGNFSSTGGLLRQKPDITAADGVSVTGVGGFGSPFYGTSAAAPHAAAIAALVKSGNPALTPTQIRNALNASALDIEAPGVDRDSGAGIIMANAALGAAGVPGTAWLDIASLTSADNPGNGNGAPEAGEGVRLDISLANYGANPASSITASLTSSTPGITVIQPGSHTYPDLPVSMSSPGSGPLQSTVASHLP